MKIAIIDSGYRSYDFERKLFEEQGIELVIHPSYKGEKSEKMNFAGDADGILVRHTVIDGEFLSGMKNLKAVVRYGVGYDNIDVEACTHYGVKAANVQGYANHAVSDHTIALIYACARGMFNPHSQVNQQFAAPPVPDIFELHDKTMGILGVGRIGSTLAGKARGLFREIIGCDPYKSQMYFNRFSVKKVTFDELLEQADVLTIHCNLTAETRHILNENALNKLKKRPVIINTSRGETVSEKALLKALDTGMIHSAGIDVFENEPVTQAQETLLNHSRTICTGHYAWYSDYAAEELQKRAATNLLNLLKGNPVEDALN